MKVRAFYNIVAVKEVDVDDKFRQLLDDDEKMIREFEKAVAKSAGIEEQDYEFFRTEEAETRRCLTEK